MIGLSANVAARRLFSVLAVASLLLVFGCGSNTRQSGRSGSGSAYAQTPNPPQSYLFVQASAWSDLTKQCSFGPRDPVLPGHDKCLKYIVGRLKPACDRVSTQNFVYVDRDREQNLALSNIFGVFNPSGKPRIMISAHWDTRPTADNDFDIGNRGKPIPGADDGASGVAVLLELARALHAEKPNCCVVLAFWDGEDWGPGEDKMYLGSVYFAAHPGSLRPNQSILLDMIGQQGLVLQREAWSQQRFPELVDSVWQAASEAGQSSIFANTTGPEVIDDQIPLAKLGIPSIDIIDFDYAYWHTLQDTPDKCDPKSLGAVGKCLEQYVRDVSAPSK